MNFFTVAIKSMNLLKDWRKFKKGKFVDCVSIKIKLRVSDKSIAGSVKTDFSDFGDAFIATVGKETEKQVMKHIEGLLPIAKQQVESHLKEINESEFPPNTEELFK